MTHSKCILLVCPLKVWLWLVCFRPKVELGNMVTVDAQSGVTESRPEILNLHNEMSLPKACRYVCK